MRLIRCTLLAVAALLLVAVPAQAATQWIGFNPRFASAMKPNPDFTYTALHYENARVFRITTKWCSLEPRLDQQGHPVWDTTEFSGLLSQVARAENNNGIKPLIVLDTFAPGFARYANMQGSPVANGCDPPPSIPQPAPNSAIRPPDAHFAPGPSASVPGWYRGAAETLMLCLMGRPSPDCPSGVQTRGDLLRGIMGLEFGNEPNLSFAWQTGLCTDVPNSNWTTGCSPVGRIRQSDADQYAQMAQQAAIGAHSVADPEDVKVATAGVNFPRGDNFPSDNVNPIDYLTEVYGGIYGMPATPQWDAVGIHPYSGYPDYNPATDPDHDPYNADTYAVDSFQDDVHWVDQLVHQGFPDDAQIWVTEVGRDSGGPNPDPNNPQTTCIDNPLRFCNQETQSQELTSIAAAAISDCPAPTRLRLLAFYNLEDSGGHGTKMGVLQEDGSPKTAYADLSTFYSAYPVTQSNPAGQPTC
jgi:hypothetical protein